MCNSSMIRRKDASGRFWGASNSPAARVSANKTSEKPEIVKPVPE
jgi:hypothetical protein